MKYAIEKTNGQWWTGTCFGAKEAREEYESLDELPDEINRLDVEIFSNCAQAPDIRYYSMVEKDAVAVVRGI